MWIVNMALALHRFFEHVRRFDWGFEAAVAVIAALGLLVQYSLSFSRADGNLFFLRHAIFFIAGLALSVCVSAMDFRLLQSWRWVFYAVGVVGLVAVLFFGTTMRNTLGWIGIGGMQFQMVEIIKPILVIALAAFWSKRSLYGSRWQDIALSFLLTVIPVFLVLRQPDLGSAVLLLFIWIAFTLLVGLRFRTLAALAVIGIVGLVVAWVFLLQNYQKDRMLSFLVPQRDPYGQGYQIRQSIVAVGSGQIVGRGFGFGPQSQQRFLPEAHTDFAFAALAEEFGLVGVSVLFAGIFFLLYRLLALAQRLRDDFAVLVVIGFAAIFSVQFAINIAMNIGLAPVVGIPFPFVSYGGSSLLVSFLMVGILQSMFIRSR